MGKAIFKTGDRVTAIDSWCDNKKIIGIPGTILGVHGDKTTYCVQFDVHMDGHGGGNRFEGRDGHCWNIPQRLLKPLNEYAVDLL